MGYSSLSDVKEILQITESTWDTELTNCITSADALINSVLKHWGFTVPLSSPYPQNVQDASKYFAAWLFRKRRDPSTAEALWTEGDKFLQAYIDAEKRQPTFLRC